LRWSLRPDIKTYNRLPAQNVRAAADLTLKNASPAFRHCAYRRGS